MAPSDWPLERDPTFGCLRYVGRRDRDGYGRLPDGRLAHRVAYELEHGPIEGGAEVEHSCRRRNCIEDDHLELFTRSEQERSKAWSWRCRKTRCKRGHDMAHAAITPERGRVCRTCAQAARAAA